MKFLQRGAEPRAGLNRGRGSREPKLLVWLPRRGGKMGGKLSGCSRRGVYRTGLPS